MYLRLARLYKNDGTKHLIQCVKWAVSKVFANYYQIQNSVDDLI